MTPVPWPMVKEAFGRILEAPLEQRDALLAACAQTPGLKTEVLSLLAAHESANQALTDTTRAGNEAGAVVLPDISPGSMIGRYRIVRLIDSGGMGSVYEALDTMLNRLVALKVLHSPLLSPSMRQRFDAESRMLARLRHPAIAQIYESGTHRSDISGAITPYFAMELVSEARPIDQWAREHKPSRIALLRTFVSVCDAIQHGHQRSIVHRDIKPANILVEGSGALKVIDFGIAQALEDADRDARRPDSGQLVGTLQYMSPEACSGDPLDVDVRADVYSLGVVLYELLSGTAPSRTGSGSLLDAVRVICEENPLPISQLDRSLTGDLEMIVHKALQKDREKRYQSAADLASDIQRFLCAQPVLAHPPAPMYLLRLFARRNKIAVTAAAFVSFALLIGLLGLTLGLSRANRAKREALIQSQRATRTSAFLINTLRSTSPIQPAAQAGTMWDADINPLQTTDAWGYAGHPGEPLTARDLISLAADKVQDQFHDDPVLRADVLSLLAGSLRETGLDTRTELFARESLELYSAALGPLDRSTIVSHLNCAQEAWLKGDLNAFADHRRIAMESSIRAFGPLDPLTRACTAGYAAAIRETDAVEAEKLLREQSRRVVAAFGGDSHPALVERVRLGYVLAHAGESLELLRSVRFSLESKGESGSLLWSEATLQIAHVLNRSCDTQAQAAEHFALVRDAFDKLIYPRNPRSMEVEATLMGCYMRMGRVDLALELSRKIADAAVSRYQPGTTGYFIDKGRHARLLAESGLELETAASLARQAVEGVDQADPVRSADWAVYFTAVRAQALRKLGRPQEALEILDLRFSKEPLRLTPAWAFGFVHNERAESLDLLGRRTEAIAASALAVRSSTEFTEPLDDCHPILRAIRVTAARLHVSGAASTGVQ